MTLHLHKCRDPLEFYRVFLVAYRASTCETMCSTSKWKQQHSHWLKCKMYFRNRSISFLCVTHIHSITRKKMIRFVADCITGYQFRHLSLMCVCVNIFHPALHSDRILSSQFPTVYEIHASYVRAKNPLKFFFVVVWRKHKYVACIAQSAFIFMKYLPLLKVLLIQLNSHRDALLIRRSSTVHLKFNHE